ncbi:pyridoxal-phosphate dependent enzyme [Chloroflexi bacterium TSY]|nr:pyridoxal-phosphate dependent enzyme [Chloroflexi bacterium TSY]
MIDHSLKTQLRVLLDKQPCYRVSILPTPLVELPRFSAELGGPRIFMKRDDMTGLAYGGNKARKLDYFVGEAVAQGCDVFIGGGGAAQSNHALMCAAAARKAGMKPVIFARAGSHHYELQGDYLLTKMLVDGGVYLYGYHNQDGKERRYRPELVDLMNQVADELRDKGFNPYVLPGSGQPSGTLGYVECALELTDQCEARGIEPSWIFLTSSGGGQAGLLVGAKFLQQNHTVVGCAPAPYGSDAERSTTVADLANRTAQLLGANVGIDPSEVTNLSYGGEAYGVPSQTGLEALHLLARTEGIFLDPVYTSKGVSGLIDQIRQGTIGPDDTVIYIHTGGLPINFAYSKELAEAFDLSLSSDHLLTLG